MTANGYLILIRMVKNTLKLDGGDSCTTLNIPKTTDFYTLNR